MTVSNSWALMPSTVYYQGAWTTPTSAQLATDPASLDPDVFASWPRDKQVEYVNAKGTGSPKTVEIGSGANLITASISDTQTVKLQFGTSSGEEFYVSDPGREATPTELATSPSSLDPDIFLSWRPEDRLKYLADRSGTVTIGSDSNPPKIYASSVPQVATYAGVIQHTSGDFEPIPYYYLSGSASGTPSAIVSASAEALFPTLNGTTSTLPVEDRPDEFYTAPSALTTDAAKIAFLQSFTTWHSAYQLEYVKQHGTGGVLDIATVGDANTPAKRFTAVVSLSDPTKLFIVQSLDKAAFAKMTLVEQNQIVATAAFSEIAGTIGLASAASANMEAYVQTLINDINNTAGQYNTAAFPSEAKSAFIRQLDILKEQLDTMGVVSPADVKKKVDDLRERYQRLYYFWDVKAPGSGSTPMGNPDRDAIYYTDVISLGGDLTGINRGYQVFLAQETRIADLAEARMKIVRDNGIFSGKNLDVPYLVYKFQSLYNLSVEAQVVAETEEINQQNDLLKTYAAIQDLINQTLSGFPKADSDSRAILGKGVDDYMTLSSDQRKLLAMFDTTLGTGQLHPMERLRNLAPRPTYDFFNDQSAANRNDENYDLKKYNHPQWSTFGTRLSEKVTLINQNSQIKMNDINSMDKQRNRHFELANNALSKMAEIIANIGRS